MEKKIKSSDKPIAARVIYGVVIAILCVTAIVVGIVAAANRRDDGVSDTPPVDNGGGDVTPTPDDNPSGDNLPEQKQLAFVSPVESGSIGTEHCEDTPVFSTTLDEWRLHAGIDIITEEDAPVFAAEDGVVTAVFKDALLGNTVEITHDDEHKTVYSNLKDESTVQIKVGDEVAAGDRIGTVGDSAITEIADEAHLHFELIVAGESKNPLDYLSQEEKATLSITA